MTDRETGTHALSWCGMDTCALSCFLLVPRYIVRRDASTQAYLDYWKQTQLLASFSETNMVSS